MNTIEINWTPEQEAHYLERRAEGYNEWHKIHPKRRRKLLNLLCNVKLQLKMDDLKKKRHPNYKGMPK